MIRTLVLFLLALAALPAAAPAATVTTSEPETCGSRDRDCELLSIITFVAGDGEDNAVTVTRTAEAIEIADPAGSPIVLRDARCTATSPTSVRCPDPKPRFGRLLPPVLRVYTTDGDDVVRVVSAVPVAWDVLVDAGPGVDVIHGAAGRSATPLYELDGGPGDDTIHGGPAGEDLRGGGGADVLRAGRGHDTLEGDPYGAVAADVLDGGPGADTVTYERRGGRVTVDLATTDAVQGRKGEGDRVAGIENAKASSGGGTLLGDDGPNELTGNGGADVLDGRGGDDTLALHGPRDVLRGGPGDDRLATGDGDLACGAGDDAIENPSPFVEHLRPAGDCEHVEIAEGVLLDPTVVSAGARRVVVRLRSTATRGAIRVTVRLRAANDRQIARRRVAVIPAGRAITVTFTTARRAPRGAAVQADARDESWSTVVLRGLR